MAVGRVPSQPGGVDSSTSSRSPSARAISWALEARCGLGSGQYLPAIVWACAPRSQGGGSNGGKDAMSSVLSMIPFLRPS